MALSDTAHEIYSACQLAPSEGVVDAVARIESLLAEVRKADDALILQLVEALENSDAALWEHDDDPSRPVHAAITAGRARLEAKK